MHVTSTRPVIATRRRFVWYFLTAMAVVGCIFVVAPEAREPLPTPFKPITNPVRLSSPTKKPDTFAPPKMHSEEEVLHFLDSVGQLDWHTLDDSVDWNGIPPQGKPSSKILKAADYAALKKGCKRGWISTTLARGIYQDIIFIGIDELDSIPIRFYEFDSASTFRYYAVQFYPDQPWACTVAFFEENRLIAIHEIEHKYGCEVEGYRDAARRQFVHFPRCMSAGAGAAEFRDCYYYWHDHKLLPTLETLRLGSCSSWARMYTLSTQPFRFDTLAVKMKYEFQFYHPDSMDKGFASQSTICQDSTTISFSFDSLTHHYDWNWRNSKLNLPQMKSYFNVENELLFVQAHRHLLKRLLTGKDEIKRKSVQYYLSETMNGNYPKGAGAKR